MKEWRTQVAAIGSDASELIEISQQSAKSWRLGGSSRRSSKL